MTNAPPLHDGEVVIYDHIPSMAKFKRTALVLIALTLPAVAVFLVILPDTFWPVVPLFVTCLMLMQERFRLGRHRAWVTNQRIVFQGGQSLDLAHVTSVVSKASGVQVTTGPNTERTKLVYAANAAELVQAIQTAQTGKS